MFLLLERTSSEPILPPKFSNFRLFARTKKRAHGFFRLSACARALSKTVCAADHSFSPKPPRVGVSC